MTAVHAMLNVTKCNFSYSEDCLAKTQKSPTNGVIIVLYSF